MESIKVVCIYDLDSSLDVTVGKIYTALAVNDYITPQFTFYQIKDDNGNIGWHRGFITIKEQRRRKIQQIDKILSNKNIC